MKVYVTAINTKKIKDSCVTDLFSILEKLGKKVEKKIRELGRDFLNLRKYADFEERNRKCVLGKALSTKLIFFWQIVSFLQYIY